MLVYFCLQFSPLFGVVWLTYSEKDNLIILYFSVESKGEGESLGIKCSFCLFDTFMGVAWLEY